nr:chromosome partitioning protein [Plantactinospora soyae]
MGEASPNPVTGAASANPATGEAAASPNTGAAATSPSIIGAAAGPNADGAPVADPARSTGRADAAVEQRESPPDGGAAETGAAPAEDAVQAGRPAEPARGRATLPASSRSQPDVGSTPRPAAESPWAQPPQRPVTPQPTTGAEPPPTGSAPPVVGPYPPTLAPNPYSAAARPVSAYPPVPGPPVHPPAPPQQIPPPPVGYPPPTGTNYPATSGYPASQGYPAYPPPPVPGPPPTGHQSGWAPQPPPGHEPPPVPPHPGVSEVPQQPYPEAPGVQRVPNQASQSYPDPLWTPDSGTPTAEDFARRRAVRPADPVAQMGVRAAVNKTTLGLVRLAPGRQEQEFKQDIEMIRRNFGGLRQVTVVNPKGGAGKTVAILLLAMTFGQKRGGYVLAWDNNETQGTLGMRAQQDFHSRTVRDMLRDLYQFRGAQGRVGDLSQYVRSQSEGMFDVLASDESATGGEMLTAAAFAEIREVVSRFYKLIFVDTGNNVRAQNWQAAIDATDQLVVTMSARNDSAETAARMLDHLEQSGRQRLVRQAVTVVSMPPSRKEIDLPAIERHFAARTRSVLLAPYERLIDTGEPIRYAGLSSATRDAWLKIAASVAEGL